MIQKIDFDLTGTDSIGLTHDSRKDVRTLAKVINILIDKVNELVQENNEVRRELEEIHPTLS